MKSLYVADLTKGMSITSETFAVQEAELTSTKENKPYYKVMLADKTGVIRAFIWSDNIPNIEKGSIKPGNIILIDGLVEEFKNVLQIIIQRANRVEESYLDDFIEGSDFDLTELGKELDKYIAAVKNTKIKTFLTKLFSDQDLEKKFKTYPAAEYVHHSFRGGLLEHVVEMLDLVQPLKKYYPEANFDLISAGIILHDLGKLWELESLGVTVKRTKEGYLIGHLIKSFEILTEKGKGILSDEQMLNLKHIILSHHGSLEYGSPVIPATIEAVIVHLIDMTSSKTRIFQRIIRQHENMEEEFTEWNKILGTKVYRRVSDDDNE